MTTEWKCPQPGCTKPLEAHLVTRADRFLAANQPAPKTAKR